MTHTRYMDAFSDARHVFSFILLCIIILEPHCGKYTMKMLSGKLSVTQTSFIFNQTLAECS